MRARFHRVFAMLVAASLLVACVHPIIAVAAPSTPEIEARQEELSEAQAELDRMADRLSLQVEEYNTISEVLEQTRDEIAAAEEDLVHAKADVADAERTLGDRAAEIYKRGRGATLEVLLGIRSFEDFLVRLDWVHRLSVQDALLVRDVRDARDRVEHSKSVLETREAEQVALRDEARSQRLAIETSIERQGSFVASLDDEIRQLIAAEEERQRKLAKERARQAAEEAARAVAAAAAAATENDTSPFPDPDISTGPGRAEVVRVGLLYLGVPYAWGGSDPAVGFDCSGLTQYVYAQVDVHLPRTSRSQFRSGTHIPEDRLDLLALGDLVFFGYDGDPDRVHHVGIYVGERNYLHAPQAGDVVRVSSLGERIAQKGDYVGASRF